MQSPNRNFYQSTKIRTSTTFCLLIYTDKQIGRENPHHPFPGYTNKNEKVDLHKLFSFFVDYNVLTFCLILC